MSPTLTLLAACLLTVAWAQQYTTPVPILKQINRHNDDGSYSYGYEAADGSFKIETKYPDGEVFGKYGYVDDQGQVREVEYGASRRGFEPAGNDINVPPPTLTVSNNNKNLGPNDVDDGQYREDPSVYWKNPEYNRPRAQQQQYTSVRQYSAPVQTQPQQQYYSQPQQQVVYNPPQQQYNPPQQQYNPPQQQYNPPQQQYNPPQQQYYQQPARTFNPSQFLNPAQLVTHPAVTNADIFSGSYSISYKK